MDPFSSSVICPRPAPQTGGFDAADFACRVDAAGGDVTAAVHLWLVETGRIRPDAHIIHLEVRTWRRP